MNKEFKYVREEEVVIDSIIAYRQNRVEILNKLSIKEIKTVNEIFNNGKRIPLLPDIAAMVDGKKLNSLVVNGMIDVILLDKDNLKYTREELLGFGYGMSELPPHMLSEEEKIETMQKYHNRALIFANMGLSDKITIKDLEELTANDLESISSLESVGSVENQNFVIKKMLQDHKLFVNVLRLTENDVVRIKKMCGGLLELVDVSSLRTYLLNTEHILNKAHLEEEISEEHQKFIDKLQEEYDLIAKETLKVFNCVDNVTVDSFIPVEVVTTFGSDEDINMMIELAFKQKSEPHTETGVELSKQNLDIILSNCDDQDFLDKLSKENATKIKEELKERFEIIRIYEELA